MIRPIANRAVLYLTSTFHSSTTLHRSFSKISLKNTSPILNEKVRIQKKIIPDNVNLTAGTKNSHNKLGKDKQNQRRAKIYKQPDIESKGFSSQKSKFDSKLIGTGPVTAEEFLKHVQFCPVDEQTILYNLIPNIYSDDYELHRERIERGPDRIIIAARQSGEFDLIRLLMDRSLSALRASSFLECAHSLAEMKARNIWNVEDYRRRDDLMKIVENSSIPPPIKNTIDLFITVTGSSALSHSRIITPNIRQKESVIYAACAALRHLQWDYFIELTSQVLLAPHEMLLLLSNLVNYVKTHEGCEPLVASWYYSQLCRMNDSHCVEDWKAVTERINRLLNVRVLPVNVTPSGKFDPCLGVSLPTIALTQQDMHKLHSSFDQTVAELTKTSGSISVVEVAAVRSIVHNLKKSSRGKDLIVIDALNLAHNHFDNERVYKFINSVVRQFGNAILVTRKFMVAKLNRKFEGNVKTVIANKHSEDDMLVLLSALTWGERAWILSNDKFLSHIAKVEQTSGFEARELFVKWLKMRTLRFEKESWTAEHRRDYSVCVSRLSPSVFYIPIRGPETGFIPQYKEVCVILPKKR